LQGPRDELVILRGWVILRLNFWLKGYVSRNGANIDGPLDGGLDIGL